MFRFPLALEFPPAPGWDTVCQETLEALREARRPKVSVTLHDNHYAKLILETAEREYEAWFRVECGRSTDLRVMMRAWVIRAGPSLTLIPRAKLNQEGSLSLSLSAETENETMGLFRSLCGILENAAFLSEEQLDYFRQLDKHLRQQDAERPPF